MRPHHDLRSRRNVNAALTNRLAADDAARRVLPAIRDICAALGADATLTVIATILNQRGLRARRGGAWTTTAVRRVLARFPSAPPVSRSPGGLCAHAHRRRRQTADSFAHRFGPLVERQRAAGATWAAIAEHLEQSGVRTPRGRRRWAVSSVRNLWCRSRAGLAGIATVTSMHLGGSATG